MNTATKEDLQVAATRIRRRLLEAIHAVGTGHAGPSLSVVEILVLLYRRHLRASPRAPQNSSRDRLVFSKGHGAPALYATLAEAGYFPDEELETLRQLDSRLHGHPVAGTLPGVDATTGSLGQGLSLSTGLAIGLGLQGLAAHVYCIVGDGELQEGQNWEAAAFAAGQGVNNLTVIVDRNGLQNDGFTEHIHPIEDVATRFTAFGWTAQDVDGHDLEELDSALDSAKKAAGPVALVARTTKGKGVSFMEDVIEWHHQPIDDAQLARALSELEAPR